MKETHAWSNWSHSETCAPARLHFARSVEDVSAVVAEAAEHGMSVRVAGSGHSHYRLVPTDGVVLDVSGLTGVIETDVDAGTARVWGGRTSMATQPGSKDAATIALTEMSFKALGGSPPFAPADLAHTSWHRTGSPCSATSAAMDDQTGAPLVLVQRRCDEVHYRRGLCETRCAQTGQPSLCCDPRRSTPVPSRDDRRDR